MNIYADTTCNVQVQADDHIRNKKVTVICPLLKRISINYDIVGILLNLVLRKVIQFMTHN